MKELTDYEIAWKGQLWVNLPVMVIIIGVWYFLICFTNWNAKLCLFIGFALGWIYWEIMVNRWLKWALQKKVEVIRLVKIGKHNLLIWGPYRVEKVANKIK